MPQTIRGYSLTLWLGSGGMGEVYQAHTFWRQYGYRNKPTYPERRLYSANQTESEPIEGQ